MNLRALGGWLLGYPTYSPDLPRIVPIVSCAVYALITPQLLASLLLLTTALLLAAELMKSSSVLRRIKSGCYHVLVLVAWAPCAILPLLALLVELASLLRLRAGSVVRVRQNVCMHGFMVMPELVVNTVLALDALCGRGRVLLKIDFGETTMDGGKHPYFSAAQNRNVWRDMFDDSLAATDDPDAPVVATFGYFLHGVVHHMFGTFFYPHGAGTSTMALPPSWSGRDADLSRLPYSRQVHAWFGAQRARFAEVMRRIELRPAAPIREEVELLWGAHFSDGDFVLGVHARGTDKAHSGGIVYPEAYFPYIDHFLRQRRARLFLATDSPRFLEGARPLLEPPAA